MIARAPRSPLRPFVSQLWATDGTDAVPARSSREHVLPGGEMHLVFRSSGPLRLFADADDLTGCAVGRAVVGGARGKYYIRDVSPSASVGAMLRPGTSTLLFGLPATELTGRHVALEDIWSHEAALVHERLFEIDNPADRLALFESILIHRLPAVHSMHPAVAFALERFQQAGGVEAVVARTGYSHRHFITLFRTEVGLAPKTFTRTVRFQQALREAFARPELPWADIAHLAGYSDQAHFSREFRNFAGVTPSVYRATAPRRAGHVPLESDPVL